jgi:hypothetical protein
MITLCGYIGRDGTCTAIVEIITGKEAPSQIAL